MCSIEGLDNIAMKNTYQQSVLLAKANLIQDSLETVGNIIVNFLAIIFHKEHIYHILSSSVCTVYDHSIIEA